MMTLCLLSTLSVSAFAASAHNLKTADKLSTFVQYGTAPMYVDCSKGSAAVKALEIKNHDCPAQTTNAVGPLNQVGGSCGTAYIYGSGVGFGFAKFAVGGSSSKGGILNVSYIIRWIGGLAGPGLTTGTVFPFGSKIWADVQDVLTGSGRITSVLSGAATLKSGEICTINNPNSNFNA